MNYSLPSRRFHHYPSFAPTHLVLTTHKLEPPILSICSIHHNLWSTNFALSHQSLQPIFPPLPPLVFSPSYFRMTPRVNPEEQSTTSPHQHGLRSCVAQSYVHYHRNVPLVTQFDIENRVNTLGHDMSQVIDIELQNIWGAWVLNSS